MTEYKDELKRKTDQDGLINMVKKFDDNPNQRVVKSKCPGCPAGLIQQVKTELLHSRI